MCIFFHKWSKWESYSESGTVLLGRIYPKTIQGKEVPYIEKRQKRACKKCGKVQDELIR